MSSAPQFVPPPPLPRPVPSLATLPSSSSKKARRARRAASRDSQRAAAAGATSGAETSTAAHLHNIRGKEKARKSSLKKGQQTEQTQPQQPPQSQSPSHPSDIAGAVGGLPRSLADWMLAKIQSVQSWQSKGEQQRPVQPSSRASAASASSRPVTAAGFGFGWSAESASSDPAATSGNETDWEQAAVAAQGSERQQQPTGSQASSATASRSNSDLDAPPSPLHRVSSPSSAAPLVACQFAEFGCEARVRQGGPHCPSPDPHYASAAAHHVSLLHATCTILSSQKQQQAQLMEMLRHHSERMVAHDERMQRRLQRKADVVAQLRQRLDQTKAALQHANALRLRNVQDLVGSFVGQAPPDARKLLRAQHDEIADLRAQLAVKEQLLREVADCLRNTPQQQQQQQQQPTTQGAPVQSQPHPQEHEKPAPRAQKKKQRAAAPAAPVAPAHNEQPKPTDVKVASPPPAAVGSAAAAPPAAAVAGAAADASGMPLGASSRSPILGSVKSPLSPAPFRLSAGSFKVPAQRVPKVSALQQQHEQREAAAIQLAREQAEASQQAATSQSTAYYKLPHSSLKALGPLVSSAQMLNLVSSFATGQAPTIVYTQQTNQNTAANHRQERAGTGPATTGAEGQPHGAARTGAFSSRGGGGVQTDDDSDREESAAPFTFNTSDEPGAIRSTPVGAAKLCPQMWRQTMWTPINQKPRQEGM